MFTILFAFKFSILSIFCCKFFDISLTILFAILFTALSTVEIWLLFLGIGPVMGLMTFTYSIA